MRNMILIYDDNCPFCCWYSGLFVKYNFLEQNGRIAFSTLDPVLLEKIDYNKSRNEIPLLDTCSGEVSYGIDALLTILGSKYPFVRQVGNFSPIKWTLRKIYKLVSFNRKLIVAKKCSQTNMDCSPDLNYFYRFLFMAMGLLLNSLALFPLHALVLSKLPYFNLSITQLQLAHIGLVVINCGLALGFKKEKATIYLGQVNMLAIVAILLQLPLFLLINIPGSSYLIIIYFILLSILIFKEYLRRMEYAGFLLSHKWLVSINLASLSGFILFLFGNL